MTTSDPYGWWRRALAGEKIGGATLPVHDGEPQPGFYRRRTARGGAFVPVAIWPMGDDMVAIQDEKEVSADDVWTYCCTHPVTEENYNVRNATGKWQDEDAGLADATASPPPIGDNGPPTDPLEILKTQIAAGEASAATYTVINDDETASKAQSIRSRLLELSGMADKARVKEKEPHLEAGRLVDTIYQPLVKASKAAADKLALLMGAHETRKRVAAQEAARIAAQEALAEARVVAEAAKLAEPTETEAPVAYMPEPPAPVPPPPAPLSGIRGAYGRKASVKVERVGTVTDYAACLAHFRMDPEIVELVEKLAKRAVKNGHDVPGVTVTEESKVV